MRATHFLASGLVASTLALGATCALVEEVQAASFVGTYEATAAQADQYAIHGGGNAFWFFRELGGSQDFVFDNGPGSFTVNNDGTAQLVGTIVSKQDSDKKWDVDLLFGPSNFNTPKKELKPEAYKENGGPVDTDTWQFFDLVDSTVTGLGDFDGLSLELTQRPPNGPYAFQLGKGASGKNINLGFSGWYEWEIKATDPGNQQPVTDYMAKYGKRLSGVGDINIDLERVPEASMGGALAMGTLALAMLSRRKKNRAD